MRFSSVVFGAAASLSLVTLTSCSSSQIGNQTLHAAIKGIVMGGEQPITAATVQLYAVGTSTDGGAATALINQAATPVTTSDGRGQMNANANASNHNNTLSAGSFDATGDFTCPAANPEVYLVSIGGNPGAGTNAAQEQIVALGPCGNIATATYVVINEVTTVGTVSSLYNFMSGYANISSTPAHAPSLAAAFSIAAQYVDVSNGTAPGPALASGHNASDNELRALANVVQGCVNSNGGGGGTCPSFFAAAQGNAASQPTDTVTALINIFNAPTRQVSTLFNLQPAQAAFQPTNASAPTDWTLPILQIPATPVISPNGGTYTSVQSVSISESDSDTTAHVYYTIDGSTPTAASTLYTGTFTVSASQPIKAICIDAGRLTSPVVSATFALSGISAPLTSLSSIQTVPGSTTGVTLTAFSNASGSVVTFGTTAPVDGSFSPATCTITSGSCSVSYVPSGILPVGTYTNDLYASFSAAGSYSSGAATSTLTLAQSFAESIIASFTGTTGATPGQAPQTSLIQASDGNFYGTTYSGGPYGFGTVYKITPAGTYGLLHSFSGTANDGKNPFGGLVQGTDGNFYGTTGYGGANSAGTVYKMTAGGTFTLLRSFSSAATDGNVPNAGLVQGTDGNFYGTTSFGGASTYGTAYKISPTGTFTLLHSFTGTTNDGRSVNCALVQGTDGNFYGTTGNGGANNAGTVFKVSSTGTFSLVYSFSSAGPDGQYPQVGLVQGTDGNFYGTTPQVGANGFGTVFKVSPTGTFTLLHSFVGGAADGDTPYAGLILGTDGNFYGATWQGGAPGYGFGTAFKVSPTGTFTMLHSFTSGTTDGRNPSASLVQGADGNFYGTTWQGGAGNLGTIYKLTSSPTLSAPVALTVPASVAPGSTFTMGYSVANASSATLQQCFATNNANDNTGWTGIKTGSPTNTNVSLNAPASAGTYTYTLTCGGMESGLATLNVH